MKRYANLGGNSSVIAYEYGATSITIQFKSGSPYTYSYASAGQSNVEHMKKLADAGRGLCSFVQTHVKYKYIR